ncbi:MAG TPA: hypothetical protein DCR27_13450 [Lachnospiraceae bacterium]|nr:hypothetical protein [Lachnospiraceae bacterium]
MDIESKRLSDRHSLKKLVYKVIVEVINMGLIRFCKRRAIHFSGKCISFFKKIEIKCGYQESNEKFIANINWDPSKKQQRVLVSYLDFGWVGERITEGATHTNLFELYPIIRYFLQRDYVLDICGCNDADAITSARKHDYDVVFGFGMVFRTLASSSNAYMILYLTENPYYISYQKEQERIAYFYERNHIKPELERTGIFYQKDDEKLADAIICLGHPGYVARTGKQIIRIWPSALTSHSIPDFSSRSAKSFLVLGTDGFVHKGIDLLIETFRHHNDWNLFLCGSNLRKTLKKLKYLPLSPNIRDCGFINIYGDTFSSLAKTCTYILLPSCSEAPSTAILTGMCHGLLPIVMKGNGLDELAEYCLYFDSYDLLSIERKLQEAAQCPQSICIDRAWKVMRFAQEKFTLENFRINMEKALSDILNQEGARG